MVALALLAPAAGRTQQQPGPMNPPANPPLIHRIPLYPQVPPPPMSPDQIIAHFISNETLYQAEYKKYGFLQTIRVKAPVF